MHHQDKRRISQQTFMERSDYSSERNYLETMLDEDNFNKQDDPQRLA